MATDVLVLCGVGIDTIVRVPELVVPPGDLLHVEPVRDYVAHSGNGVALGFHALGLRTKFIDFLGDDALGALILARYAAVGLDFEHVPAPNGTPRSVNLVDAAGRRFSFFDGRHPEDLRLPREAYLPALEQARHVHVAGRAAEAFAEARRLGVTTSTDIHSWDGESAWGLHLAREADLVFLSAAAAPQKIDDLMHTILDAGRATMVVATEGEAGSRVLTRTDRRIVRFPAVEPERPVVDSNGAGDGFSTAFMSRWFAGRPLDECVLAGAVSGAFACGAAGTHEEQITAAQLDAAIARAADSDRWRGGRD
jgi:sugar/nucleoside kinase (ribokinase family)